MNFRRQNKKAASSLLKPLAAEANLLSSGLKIPPLAPSRLSENFQTAARQSKV
jgi:hypothetical protein